MNMLCVDMIDVIFLIRLDVQPTCNSTLFNSEPVLLVITLISINIPVDIILITFLIVFAQRTYR